MRLPARFNYAQQDLTSMKTDVLPFMPVQLQSGSQIIEVTALVDTGAVMNVLPYFIGAQFGFNWEEKPTLGYLGGNLARVPARGLALQTTVASFEPVLLLFAWAQTDDVPLLLGQLNFFDEFSVCFFRSQSAFEVTPKSGDQPRGYKVDNSLQVKPFTEAEQQLAANNSKFNTLLAKVLETPAEYPNLSARLLAITTDYSSGIRVEAEIDSLYAMCAKMIDPDAEDAFGITQRYKPSYLCVRDTLSREWEGHVVRVQYVNILDGSIDYSDFPKYDITPVNRYHAPTQPIMMNRFVQPSEKLKSGLVSGTTRKYTSVNKLLPSRIPYSSADDTIVEEIPWQAEACIKYALILHGVMFTKRSDKYKNVKICLTTVNIEHYDLKIMKNGDYKDCSPRTAEAEGCIQYIQPDELGKYDLSQS